MWPHSIVVGVNRAAVTVGTDDAELVAFLEPWRVDEPRTLVDFGLLLHPEQPEERSAPRVLPSLKFGSDVIARFDDRARLRDGLLRMITAAVSPPADGLLRMSGAVLERSGVAYIVPEGNLRTISLRWLGRFGLVPWPSQTVLVDAASLEVQWDVALGSTGPGRRLPIAGIWLNHREPTVDTTPGEDIARLLGNCVLDGSDLHPGRVGALAQSMVSLVTQLRSAARPRYVAFGRQALENELTALFGR